MIYLTDADLTADSFQRFIDDSTEDVATVLDKNEERAIGIARSYLQGRYDVDKIFDENDPIRDELLADIITKITLYKVFSRNAMREISTNIKEDYNWALKQLQKLSDGNPQLKDLPVPTDENGDSTISPMYGNNTNRDFYM